MASAMTHAMKIGASNVGNMLQKNQALSQDDDSANLWVKYKAPTIPMIRGAKSATPIGKPSFRS